MEPRHTTFGGGRNVCCARALQKVGCLPPRVPGSCRVLPLLVHQGIVFFSFSVMLARGPRVLNSAAPMLFCIDYARFCRWVVFRGVPGINSVIIGAVRALCPHCAKTPPGNGRCTTQGYAVGPPSAIVQAALGSAARSVGRPNGPSCWAWLH